MGLPRRYGVRWWRSCAATVLSAALVAVEMRDLYARAVWQDTTPHQPLPLHTGDVLFVCNRWYALPWPSHALYSFACKLLWKSSWDEVAVVVRGGCTTASTQRANNSSNSSNSNNSDKDNMNNSNNDDDDGEPRVLYCDMTGAHVAPLRDFLAARQPRGVAVRHLQRGDMRGDSSSGGHYHSNNNNNDDDDEAAVVRAFVRDVTALRARPWYALRAGLWPSRSEQDVYAMSQRLHSLRVRLRDLTTRQFATPSAVHDAQQHLHELTLAQARRVRELRQMRHGGTNDDKHDDSDDNDDMSKTLSRHLTNGALVASLLAALGLLPRDAAPLSRYTAVDFAHDVPLTDAHVLEPPLVFFAT